MLFSLALKNWAQEIRLKLCLRHPILTSMSNTDDGYVADLYFTLSEECSVQIEPPPGIRFETKDTNNNDGTKSITGFVVTVKASTQDEALNKAKTEAKRLVDILAVLSGGYLGYTLRGHNMRNPDGRNTVSKTFVSSYNINSSELVDLSQGNFPKLIKTLEPQSRDLRLVERLNHANNGLEAAKNNLYEVMIKEFYLAMAEKAEARKYEPLRDVLSHHEQIKPDTMKKLEDKFGKGYFDLPYCKFDHSSTKNIEHLQIQAKDLMEIAMNYIRKELKKQMFLTKP
jgi:hypothetical protein